VARIIANAKDKVDIEKKDAMVTAARSKLRGRKARGAVVMPGE